MSQKFLMYQCFKCYIFKNYLFIYSWETQSTRERERERERERQRHRQREKQAPCRKPDVGLDPRSPGSLLGPKVGAEPLSHPGCPKCYIFLWLFPLYLRTEILSYKEYWWIYLFSTSFSSRYILNYSFFFFKGEIRKDQNKLDGWLFSQQTGTQKLFLAASNRGCESSETVPGRNPNVKGDQENVMKMSHFW